MTTPRPLHPFPRRPVWLRTVLLALSSAVAGAQTNLPITFHQNFAGGSLGKIEKLGDAEFRCHVAGQHDQRGRNRQATWYCFRMENLAGRDVTLTLTDLVGEYNDKPGACAMNAATLPVFSADGERWQHFSTMAWDELKKEATLRVRATNATVWIAHMPPYTTRHLGELLTDLAPLPSARIEVIGRTVQGRELPLITVTDFDQPDREKKVVWLIARQHAWEAGTSFVMEGALRFIAGDTPEARALRAQVVFKFLPMLDPDGVAGGKVRFNANGYDVNRHWSEVDLRQKRFLEQMPEIWYAKKAILSHLDSGAPIDLMINLHNTETSEFVDSQADTPLVMELLRRFDGALARQTTFDPSHAISFRTLAATDTNSLFRERRVPVVLIEQRIAHSPKLGRQPTVADRLRFGRELLSTAAQTVLR